MLKSNIQRDADEVLNRSAVTFDTYRRYNNQSAWPFFYPFIPKPYLETDILNGGQGLMGIKIKAGQIKDIPIQLDRDSVYRLLNIKYTGYYCALGDAILSQGDVIFFGESVDVTGVGTIFLTDLSIGQHFTYIDNESGKVFSGVVKTIESDIYFTMEQPDASSYDNITESVEMYDCLIRWYDTPPALKDTPYANEAGTIEIASGGNDMVGVDADFVTNFVVGDVIQVNDANGQPRRFMIATITDLNNAILTETLSASDAGIPALSTFIKVGSAGTGTMNITGSGEIFGIGTDFVTDFLYGDLVLYPDANGVVKAVSIANIEDGTGAETNNATDGSGGFGIFALGIKTNISNILPSNLHVVRPLTDFLRVSVIMSSLRGRYLLGGTQEFLSSDPDKSGMRERPLLISALQGVDDGLGQLRTNVVYPFDSSLKIRIHNLYTQDIKINGTLFGYKISMENN